MKKFIRIICMTLIIAILGTIICNYKAIAINEQSGYISVSDVKSLYISNLYFQNMTFHDYSQNSTRAFGVSGYVNNEYDIDMNYEAVIYYYDNEYNLITVFSDNGILYRGNNYFNLMSNLDILKGHEVSDIAYYGIYFNAKDGPIIVEDDTYVDDDYRYDIAGYTIDKYDVDINVNENNTFDITETITANFVQGKHGIFRTIPISNKVNRIDGTTSKNHAQVFNLRVDGYEYSTSKENGNLKVKIGSASKLLTGEHTYVIKYTYNIGKDPMKDYDEIYYNIIGNEWDTIISGITFSIKMPKDFDASKLGFAAGYKGSINAENVEYRVDGKTIKGSYNGVLSAGEGLTVRCELSEGYFVGDGYIVDYSLISLYVPVFVAFAIIVILWFRFGRKKMSVDPIEYYPPESMNSLELAFNYKGYAKTKDVTSLLIYLANKGYVSIRDKANKESKDKNEKFVITKLKDYDGKNVIERAFMVGLFGYTRKEASDKTLRYKFYKTNDKILNIINDKENKKEIIQSSARILKVIMIILSLLIFIYINMVTVFIYGEIEMIAIAAVFPTIAVLMWALMATKEGISGMIGVSIWAAFFGGMPFIFTVIPAILSDPLLFVCYTISIVCICAILVLQKKCDKRTEEGTKIYGRINGFKRFLETAEKNQLEAMVLENPNYFFDILPYTYVLGISKFEEISMKEPDWYHTSGSFSTATFNSFMTSTMTSASRAMASSYSSSSGGGGYSGGGSSGGGSSGGGSGGGGGGSW